MLSAASGYSTAFQGRARAPAVAPLAAARGTSCPAVRPARDPNRRGRGAAQRFDPRRGHRPPAPGQPGPALQVARAPQGPRRHRHRRPSCQPDRLFSAPTTSPTAAIRKTPGEQRLWDRPGPTARHQSQATVPRDRPPSRLTECSRRNTPTPCDWPSTSSAWCLSTRSKRARFSGTSRPTSSV